MGQEQLQEMLENLGSVGVMMPVIALAVGLGLWLLGRRLARPVCAFSGLVLGGLGGLALGEAMLDQGGMLLPIVIGAAIAGALLAALLFRVWMALSGALIFGLAASCAVLLWQEPPAPSDDAALANDAPSIESAAADTDSLGDDDIILTIPNKVIAEAIRDLASKATGADATDAGDGAGSTDGLSVNLGIDRETAQQVGSAIVEAMRSLAGYYREQLGAWWSSTGTGARGVVGGVGLIAAIAGLGLGLIGPYTAASVQSAVAGSVLMLFASFSLLAQLMPEHLGWLPATPRSLLVCLGLITALGLVIQWTLFARKADK